MICNHFLGMAGMPQGIPDYPDAFEGWNYISSMGSIISVVAFAIFMSMIYNVLGNPWDVPQCFTRLLKSIQTGHELPHH